ncbi:MAG TPA: hypothetical protein VFK80_00185 [Limnochordia bacterium]|nr:hypothetical protein [Limnochordia bacterium]
MGGVTSFLLNVASFGGTAAVLFGLANWLIFREPVAASVVSGLTFGVIYGAMMAIMYRTTSFTLPSGDRKSFFNRFTQMMEKMRFDVIDQGRDYVVFKYRPFVLKFGRPRIVRIEVREGTATVTGPRVLLKQLRLRLKPR